METPREPTLSLLGHALVFAAAWILFASALVAAVGGTPDAGVNAQEPAAAPSALISER